MEQEIIDYIIQVQKHGLTDFEIKQNLLNAGWEAETVETNFVSAKAANPGAVYNSPVLEPADKPAQTQTTVAVLNQATQPQPVLSEKSFTTQPAGNKKYLIIYGALFLAACLLAGYFVYFKPSQMTADSVWKKFLATQASQPETGNLAISYSSLDETNQNVNFTLSDKFYLNNAATDDKQAKHDFTLSIQNATSTYSTSTEMIRLGNNYYANSLIAKVAVGFTRDEWLEFNPETYFAYTAKQETKQQKNYFSNYLKAAADFVQKSNIFLPGTYLATEKISGTPVYHLKPVINNDQFKENFSQLLEKYYALSNDPKTASSTELDKSLLAEYLKAIQIKNFDIWIGQKDFHLYKINFTASFPDSQSIYQNFVYSTLPILWNDSATTRDVNRFNGIRAIQTNLMLYYLDHNGYPDAKNGQPLGFAGNVFKDFPTAPEPADGDCSEYYNAFWYKPVGKSKVVNDKVLYPDYTLTYCLGSDTSGKKAGIGRYTSTTDENGISCPINVPEYCKNPISFKDRLLDVFKKINFAATLTVTLSDVSFGKTQNVVAPSPATDYFQQLLDKANSTSSDTPASN